MVLGFSEDFLLEQQVLDSQLTNPTSGLFINSGVHASITTKNLLKYLPFDSIDIAVWDSGKDYKGYSTSRNRVDLVKHNNIIYESLQPNTDKQPNENPLYWLPTNLESLKIKNLISKTEDRVYAALNLTPTLINNQYLYEVGDTEKQLPNDYAAWVFEAKGSDYVTFKINEVCLQALTEEDVNLYVINQGRLIDTLVLHPKNGLLEFEQLDYEFKGKGKLILAIDSTSVLVGMGGLDPFLYDGFVVYTANGIGDDPQTATYSESFYGNGLGFNVTVTSDASKYITNNIRTFASLFRAAFEYVALEMFLYNPSQRGNLTELSMSDAELKYELRDDTQNTSIRRYNKELEKAKTSLSKTYDTQLNRNKGGIKISVSSL